MHKPKFTTACQSLVNACQATEQIIGASLILTLDTANRYSRVMRSTEIAMFDFKDNGDKTFTVTLKP